MTIMATDPRTEQVQDAADDVEHIYCVDCWVPGMPLLCGESTENGGEECEAGHEDCRHPTCPMCEYEFERHKCPELPSWWLG